MKNIDSYRKRFYGLLESTMGNVKPLLNEQSENVDIYNMCLGFLYNLNSDSGGPMKLKYKGDVMRYCQAKRNKTTPPNLSNEAQEMFKAVLNTLKTSSEKETYRKEGVGVKVGDQI